MSKKLFVPPYDLAAPPERLMQLFRTGERTNLGRIVPGQSAFEWLDESAKPEAIEARRRVQMLFDRYPPAHQAALARRIRSSGPDHDAALVELYVHELLRQCKFEICIDPVTSVGSRPEFRICSGGREWYVEVTTDSGPNTRSRQKAALDKLVMETTQRVRTSGIGIFINDFTAGKGNPSPRKLAAVLDKWFESFDYSQMREQFRAQGMDAMPTSAYSEDSGWRVSFGLWPLRDRHQRLQQIAGTMGFDSGWSCARRRLRENIQEKKKQHGRELPLILVIACNNFADEPDDEDVLDVLLGTSQWTINFRCDSDAAHGRKNNGLWAPTNVRASSRPAGLILMKRVYPCSFQTVAPVLWDNPNAPPSEHLKPWIFARLTWQVPGSGEMAFSNGDRSTIEP